jgi:hypothetical protein
LSLAARRTEVHPGPPPSNPGLSSGYPDATLSALIVAIISGVAIVAPVAAIALITFVAPVAIVAPVAARALITFVAPVAIVLPTAIVAAISIRLIATVPVGRL